jgi:probable phosphoglycerate mutase
MILYYVRHGEPIYVPDSLTEYGVEQAKALAKRFTLYGLDEVYTSTSVRAMQTAKETCELLKINPTLLDWAKEDLVWNEFTVEKDGGKTWLFHDKKCLEKFCSKEMLAVGENWVDSAEFADTKTKSGKLRIDREVDEFFLKLGFKHNREKGCYDVVNPNGKRIAFFAHQGFGVAFLSSVLDVPYPIFSTRFDMGHTGVTVVYFDEKNPVSYPKILQLSNDSHLYKEGILKGYQGWIDI